MIRNIILIVSLLIASEVLAQTCPEIHLSQGVWMGTPLHDAIHANDIDGAQRLMSASTINARDSFGNTPLVYALTPSQALEPAGIVSEKRARALILAENKARFAIVSALLSKGAAVNEPGALGVTPLMKLANGGYAPDVERRLAERFLKAGANVNAQDDFGLTALIVAAQRGKTSLVTLLLASGADPTIANCRGETAGSFLPIKK
jgi:ankyrin repeat protein